MDEYNQRKEMRYFNEENNKKIIPTSIKILLSLLFTVVLFFSIYLIFISFDKVNNVYIIVNAISIFIITLLLTISIRRLFLNKSHGILIFSIILTVMLIIFNALVLTNTLKLPTQPHISTYKSVTDAVKWAEDNNIDYELIYDYSDTIEKYNVINQNYKENTLVRDIDKVVFEISSGPNYSKDVIITDMTGWNIDEVVKVIDKNYLNNVVVNYEENLDIEKDTVISQSKSGTIKRSDEVVLTVSLGSKENIKDIELKDLTDETLFKATLYLKRNSLKYEIEYDFSDKIQKGNVIKQSVKEGTKLKVDDTVKLTISKGKKIVVPDLKNKKMSECTKWIVKNNLKVNYSDRYDDNIKSGYIIESNKQKGEIIEEESTIDIVVSKGKLKMPKFKNINEFKTWAEKYNVKYEIKEEFNDDIDKGEIIKFSISTGKKIKTDETVIAYVSKGKAVEVPDLTNKSKSDIQNTCSSLNIVCNFAYEYSSSVKEGYSISQSVKAKEKISQGDSITITLATSSKTKANTTKSSSKSTSTTSTNNSSSSSSSTPACTNYTLNLGSGNTGEQTKQIIVGQNPNLKFSWNPVSVCPGNSDTAPGALCSSSASDGDSVSNCTTITITYVS